MRPDQYDEQLNDAVDALLAGASREDVAAQLPEDLDPLVEAADTLARSGQRGVDGARPSFVLGLEEQLRTDLRLRRPGMPRVRLRDRALRWFGVLIVATLAMLVLVERSDPSDRLYGVKQTIEEGRIRLTGSAATRVDEYLETAWRRLVEVREMHERPGTETTEADWQAALDDLVKAYTAAAEEAVAAGDPTLQVRVRSAAGVAADELSRIAEQAEDSDPDRARWFLVSAAELRRSIAALPPDAGDAWLVVDSAITSPTPEPTSGAAAQLPTQLPTDSVTSRPPRAVTQPATAPAVIPTDASATAMPPTVASTTTPTTEPPVASTQEPTLVPATSAVRPPHTPQPPTPTDTPAPTEEDPGSSVIATGTPTPDSWLATSTPDPDEVPPTAGAHPETPESLPTLVDPGTLVPPSHPTPTPDSPWDKPSPVPTREAPRRPTDGLAGGGCLVSTLPLEA